MYKWGVDVAGGSQNGRIDLERFAQPGGDLFKKMQTALQPVVCEMSLATASSFRNALHSGSDLQNHRWALVCFLLVASTPTR